MKHERGMGTLMTVFSGVAALMCLLVGLQLLHLESRIGQKAAQDLAGGGAHYRQWKVEVHTGAVMSLGAGVLVFLFGLRNRAASARSAANRSREQESIEVSDDLESLSVRIFEVGADDRSIEVTGIPEVPDELDFIPAPTVWAPLAEEDPEPDPVAPTGEYTADSILKSIHEAAGPSKSSGSRPSHGTAWKSFLARIFRLN